MDNNNFYVYIYLDPRKPNVSLTYEPFYVGKGTRGRSKSHLKKSHNEFVNRKISSIRENDLQPIIILFETNLTHNEAKQLERNLILEFGTVSPIEGVKSGPLCNFRLDPIDDYPGSLSDSTKDKLRSIMETRLKSPEYRKFLSISTANSWLNDNNFRETITKKAIDRYKDDEYMKHHKQMMKDRYIQNPELKSIISKKNKEYWSSDEGRARRKEEAKARWSDPETKAKILAKRKETLERKKLRSE